MPYKYNWRRILLSMRSIHLNELHKRDISRKKGSPLDLHRYNPNFEPWYHNPEFEEILKVTNGVSVVNPDSQWVLTGLVNHSISVSGDFVEMGVYKGGTATLINRILFNRDSNKFLYLYDTFQGMPETNPEVDHHSGGDFNDVSLEGVRQFIFENSKGRNIKFFAGFLPESAENTLPSLISFAHIDLDIHDAILGSSELIYPKMAKGGIMLFDDYGAPSCYGARIAVDKFFEDKPEKPIILGTSQAFIIKQ